MSAWRTSRGGARGFAFLMSLLLFLAALYYGFNIGEIYLRYHQLLDGMRTQARLAPSISDDVIQRRLSGQADSLLPGGSPQFKITRGGNPSRITIETQYEERVALPLFKYTFTLRPRAEEPL